MYSKYVPRLIHYLDLGDLEKVEWCLNKDNIDLTQEYELAHRSSQSSKSILAHVILNEESIPQSEECLELLVKYGGDLYQPGTLLGESKHLTAPWVALLRKRTQHQARQRQSQEGQLAYAKELHFDEQGLVEKLFRDNPSTNLYYMQEAAQEAADAFDF